MMDHAANQRRETNDQDVNRDQDQLRRDVRPCGQRYDRQELRGLLEQNQDRDVDPTAIAAMRAELDRRINDRA